MTDILAHIVYVLAIWRFPLMAMLFVGIGVAVAARRSRALRSFALFCTVYVVVNLVCGTYLAVYLVHDLGTTGDATITGTYGTSTRYNGHDVVGYKVLLRTAEGQVIQTHFEDDDFIVYPPHNETRYPDVEDRFHVRYLPGFPDDFVILADDKSEWTAKLACDGADQRMAEAQDKYDFDRTSQAFRADYIASINAVGAGHCLDGETVDVLLSKVQAGR